MQRDRKTYLGSSEMSAVLGLNPWMTRSDLYYSKIEGTQKEESEAMKWGTLLEPVIIKEFLNVINYDDWHAVQQHAQHDKHDFIAGTADALLRDELIEVKTTGDFVHRKWKEAIPLHYQIQCQFLMGLHFVYKTHFVVLIAGQTLRHYTLDFDQAMYEKIITEAVSFWNDHILTQTPPSDF